MLSSWGAKKNNSSYFTIFFLHEVFVWGCFGGGVGGPVANHRKHKQIPASPLWTFLFVEVVDSPFFREMMGCEEFANSQRLENVMVMIHQKLQVPRMEVLTYISCMKGLRKGIPTHKTACIILVPETFDDMMLVGL